jgi:hypothetical protein
VTSEPTPVVPPLDDDIEDLLDDLDGLRWLPGMAQILDGFRQTLTAQFTPDETQTLCAGIAGSAGADLLSLLGRTVQHLTDPATNPSLRALTEDQQKAARTAGEQTAFALDDPDLHQPAADAAGAISPAT